MLKLGSGIRRKDGGSYLPALDSTALGSLGTVFEELMRFFW
jgi:hypothetical protein